MKSLIGEAQERIEANAEGALGAAQNVEHYEISGYGTLKAWAGGSTT